VFIDDGAVATLDHERIHHNACSAGTAGGVGVYVDGYDAIGSVVDIRHTTIAGNDCPSSQGGNALYVEGGSRVTIRDSILWGNGGDDVLPVDDRSTVSATYTLSQEPLDGEGDLSADPLFVDLEAGDLHVRAGSPAIDAADPSSPYELEPQPNGDRADLGAYGNTAEAGAAGDRGGQGDDSSVAPTGPSDGRSTAGSSGLRAMPQWNSGSSDIES
jgi:hypothetical protein